MKRNGKVKTQVKSLGNCKIQYIPKQNWRCSKCNYTETANSTAHNANIRTGYGIEKKRQIYSALQTPNILYANVKPKLST